ncbi:unnamed protein product [Candida verbasci]|uniref:Very-long-chain (3R)-3-hydroxyacyl-CoA dehydratase n=1 Tax=Candida verbasci TaxID=1227364 RepID=A0A9W4X8D5_9ASCO|nr:unnamed protein product [Candida verbasci]
MSNRNRNIQYQLPLHEKIILLYDVSGATLWWCCLGRLLILLPLVGRRFLPGGIADFFHIVAITPFINSIFFKFNKFKWSNLWSIINSIKIVWLCFGLISSFTRIAKHTTYSILIFSYCLQYGIHYSYYAFRIKFRTTPWFLFWLQYNNFYLTYPLQTVSEMVLIFLCLQFTPDDSWYELGLKGLFLAYIPIAYFAWQHFESRKQAKYTSIIEKQNA